MQENNDEQMSTLHDCNFDIDIEGEPLIILLSFPHEGTNKEGEQNDHPSIVVSLRCKSIEDPSRAQLHNHCLVDNNLGQYSSHTYFNSDLVHILIEEENVENNMTSFEDKSHDNYDLIVSEHPCPNGIDKIPYPILNQDVLVQCMDTDLASNLAIIPGIQSKTFYSSKSESNYSKSSGRKFSIQPPVSAF